MGTFQRQAAGHDHADVSTAQNDHFTTDLAAVNIDKLLRRTSGIDTSHTTAGDHQIGAGLFAASHGQHQCVKTDVQQAFLTGTYQRFFPDLQRRCAKQPADTFVLCFFLKQLRILRARQLFSEILQAEARVNALLQDPSAAHITLHDQHALGAGLTGGCRCR